MPEKSKVPDDQVVRMIVADVLGIRPHDVGEKAALVADLHATSLDFLEMVVGVEEAFHIDINDRDAAKVVFVSDFQSLIRRNQALIAEKSA